jgi:hypothetical protein
VSSLGFESVKLFERLTCGVIQLTYFLSLDSVPKNLLCWSIRLLYMSSSGAVSCATVHPRCLTMFTLHNGNKACILAEDPFLHHPHPYPPTHAPPRAPYLSVVRGPKLSLLTEGECLFRSQCQSPP